MRPSEPVTSTDMDNAPDPTLAGHKMLRLCYDQSIAPLEVGIVKVGEPKEPDKVTPEGIPAHVIVHQRSGYSGRKEETRPGDSLIIYCDSYGTALRLHDWIVQCVDEALRKSE